MRLFTRGSQRGLVSLLLIALVGVALAGAGTYVIPGFWIFGAGLLLLVLILVMSSVNLIVDRSWMVLPAAAAVVLFGVGVLMLAEGLGTSRDGKPTEVVVVDHTLEVKKEGWDRVHRDSEHKSYTHEYVLTTTDGSPIDEPMTFYGEKGYDGVDEGDTITVLIDRDTGEPMRPAENVNIGLDVAITVAGAVAALGVYGLCALLVARDAKTGRKTQWRKNPGETIEIQRYFP